YSSSSAKAGDPRRRTRHPEPKPWIPAFAGMTGWSCAGMTAWWLVILGASRGSRGLFYRRQPLSVFGQPAVDQVEVSLLQLLGNRATAADADLAAVHFADRGHFGGGAGEEGFV